MKLAKSKERDLFGMFQLRTSHFGTLFWGVFAWVFELLHVKLHIRVAVACYIHQIAGYIRYMIQDTRLIRE